MEKKYTNRQMVYYYPDDLIRKAGLLRTSYDNIKITRDSENAGRKMANSVVRNITACETAQKVDLAHVLIKRLPSDERTYYSRMVRF